MTSDFVFNPTCSACGNRMGNMTQDEFWAMVSSEGLFAVCFDCSPDEADKVPEIFWDWEEGDRFVLGGTEFEIIQEFPYYLKMDIVSHAHEHAPTLSCLSSSTKLNKTGKSDSQDTVFFDLLQCTNCGKQAIRIVEQFDEGPQKIKCYGECVCGNAWEVDCQTELVSKRDIFRDAADCDDCRLDFSLHGNLYCDYHYSLLGNHYEDALLGFGNE
jgi:hypothetical protein